MSISKSSHPHKKNEVSIVRSSAAEYLTFVAATGGGSDTVEMRYEDENLWLTQKMMATLYDVSIPAINQHLKRIFADSELEEAAVIKQCLTTAADGKSYQVKHYSLQAIIAVGFKIENERAVQFRKWANRIVKDYTIQGWTMDVDRLKSGGSVLTEDFFEKQLEKVREIRLSERKFYQKITDIYATALDYDMSATATKRFFAAVQNKLHYAIHGQTAAEVIVDRAAMMVICESARFLLRACAISAICRDAGTSTRSITLHCYLAQKFVGETVNRPPPIQEGPESLRAFFCLKSPVHAACSYCGLVKIW